MLMIVKTFYLKFENQYQEDMRRGKLLLIRPFLEKISTKMASLNPKPYKDFSTKKIQNAVSVRFNLANTTHLYSVLLNALQIKSSKWHHPLPHLKFVV